MSAAIAMAPSPAPHDRSFADISAASAKVVVPSPARRMSATPTTAAMATAQKPSSRSPEGRSSAAFSKSSPAGARSAAMPPKIIVKKEPPTSPEMATPRHRPRKLDLSKNTAAGSNGRPSAGAPSGQLTSDRGAPSSSGLGIQDVGLACLSPGFSTQDPTMRQQLERSISVREQQRQLIESRLQQSAKPGDTPVEMAKEKDPFPQKLPQTATRRKAPPGLSIVAPSHEQFAHERVIQSAPLNQTFTGRHQPQPMTRHVANHPPSNLANTSHIHHVPANQTTNRLPPISDVFAAENLGAHRDRETQSRNSMLNIATTPGRQGHVSPQNGGPHPSSGERARDYRSAEDVQAEMSGGRPELLPRLVHYGGHQPPTPPSPAGHRGPLTSDPTRHDSRFAGVLPHASRRRGRAEYEEGDSPPLGPPPSATRRNAQAMNAAAGFPLPTPTGPFGEGRDSPRVLQAKKEEFMSLCARAWDLFHS